VREDKKKKKVIQCNGLGEAKEGIGFGTKSERITPCRKKQKPWALFSGRDDTGKKGGRLLSRRTWGRKEPKRDQSLAENHVTREGSGGAIHGNRAQKKVITSVKRGKGFAQR